MSKMIKTVVNKLIKDELGQAMPLVLVLLLIGGLIIGPLMGHMSTGLRVGKMYEEKMDRFYAADSGIEDALWHAKYDQLLTLFPDPDTGGYYPYDYYTQWTYDLSDVYGENINDKDVDVTIENVWIPLGISAPSPNEAKSIIEEGQLIITGSVIGASQYQIKMSYYYEYDEDEPDYDPNGDNLLVETIGIWLPPGFQYDGNCNLEGEDYYSDPAVTNYASGKAVVWNFGSLPTLVDFPDSGDSDYPIERTITFEFSGPPNTRPGSAVSWMDTSGVSGIDYVWDADTKVYKIRSEAKEPDDPNKKTAIEAYSAKSEIREMGSALSGDYFAIGNNLMTSTNDSGSRYKYRETLFKESSATIAEDDIPTTAAIEGAWLYWSGWIDWHGYAGGERVFEDDCSSFSNWNNPGTDWKLSAGRFVGHHLGPPDTHRILTMQHNLDLSLYSGETVAISWEQDESGWLESDDRLYFAFSNDGGSTWSSDIEAFRDDNPDSPFSYTIPDTYLVPNFKMRFYLYGFNDSSLWSGLENCYIDNITIQKASSLEYPDAPTLENLRTLVEETARVNRVVFGTDDDNATVITADKWQVKENDDRTETLGTWSYSCFYDATALVKQFRDDGDIGTNGSGTYTLGHVIEANEEDPDYSFELYDSETYISTGEETGYPLGTPALSYQTRYEYAYAGWSLIIVYSSPVTKGHQLYRFDDFTFVGGYYTLEIPVTGFLTPDDPEGSRLTYFVGEGDNHYTGDYIEVNGNRLNDDVNPANNVFNSYSNSIGDASINGIDLDTYDISEHIDSGDTAADIEVGSQIEIYNVVYIILSFRSESATSGAITYLVID